MNNSTAKNLQKTKMMENSTTQNQQKIELMKNSTLPNYNEFLEFYQEDIGIDSSFNFDDTEKFLSALCGNDLFTEFEEYKFIFQTFDDNDKRKDQSLAKQIYGTFDECKNELIELNNRGASISVTINQAIGSKRSNKYISVIRALYADCDKNGLPEHYHLEPSIIVNTSNVNGIQRGHAYWLLEDNEQLDEFTPNQKLIINYYDSDYKVHELCRVMRLPGFFHRKGEPQLVTIASYNPSVRYKNQNEVIDLIPAKVDVQNNIPSAFTKWVEKVKNAKEGERNDTLHKASFVSGGMIRENVINENYVIESLSNAASETGLFDKEINETISKGIETGKEESYYKPKTEKRLSVTNQSGKMKQAIELVRSEAESGDLQWNVYKECPVYQNENIEIPDIRARYGDEFDFDVRKEDLQDAFNYVVIKNKDYHYNAVTDYCDSLIEQHGMKVTGYIEQFCELLGLREPIERIFLRDILIASVARAYNPGCYLDNVVLFYGEQGLGKSKFFEDLYGKDYYAQLPTATEENDIVATCKSVWCGEIGEWERYSSKKSQAEIKTFITKAKDVLRKFHTQSALDIPRRFVLIGTTNKKDILNDPTGNRRYWVCEITKEIDRKWVAKNRDFIWSEAIAAYKNGEQWWLTKTEEMAQKYHNENYTEESLPEGKLVLWINNLYVGEGGIRWNDNLATKGFHLLDAITAIHGDKADAEKHKSKTISALKTLKFFNKRVRVGGVQQMLWFHNEIGTITGKKSPKPLTSTEMKVTFLEE